MLHCVFDLIKSILFEMVMVCICVGMALGSCPHTSKVPCVHAPCFGGITFCTISLDSSNGCLEGEMYISSLFLFFCLLLL